MTRTVETRLDLQEESMRHVVGALTDLRNEMKTDRKEIAAAFQKLNEDLSTRARPLPFKEITASILVTIGIMTSVMAGLNWWYDARNAVQTTQIAAIERSIDPAEMAVMKYRLQQLEAMTKSSYVSR